MPRAGHRPATECRGGLESTATDAMVRDHGPGSAAAASPRGTHWPELVVDWPVAGAVSTTGAARGAATTPPVTEMMPPAHLWAPPPSIDLCEDDDDEE